MLILDATRSLLTSVERRTILGSQASTIAWSFPSDFDKVSGLGGSGREGVRRGGGGVPGIDLICWDGIGGEGGERGAGVNAVLTLDRPVFCGGNPLGQEGRGGG